MKVLEHIKRSDFNYDLPKEYIAKHPLDQRHDSKLLSYSNRKMGIHQFESLHELLEEDQLLVFNNAKVIPARLFFKRATGAVIEVLLLEPYLPSSYDEIFKSKRSVQWKCIIGNLKKWKDGEIISLRTAGLKLEADLLNRNKRIVALSWDTADDFHDVLDLAGKLPIPPYLERDTEESDYQDYQTIYAKQDGSVAAPTAGLHFTAQVLQDLSAKGIVQTELTLHVGAGTFLPVKSDEVIDHPMHREHFELSKEALNKLVEHHQRIAVGTTSLRVLESLYYCGVQLSVGLEGKLVSKLEPYEVNSDLTFEEALGHILQHLERRGEGVFHAATEIMILPQYQIKSITALLTNFHLPESTLLMLISSVVGDDWRRIYQTAMQHDFRFLSYGDSSLLFCK